MNSYPCKNCDKRTLGCHSKCEEYNLAKNEQTKIKEEKRNDAKVASFIDRLNKETFKHQIKRRK